MRWGVGAPKWHVAAGAMAADAGQVFHECKRCKVLLPLLTSNGEAISEARARQTARKTA
jgi:hypothetical protein